MNIKYQGQTLRKRWAWPALFILGSTLAGCTYEKVVHDGWDQFRDLEDPKSTQDSSTPANATITGPTRPPEPRHEHDLRNHPGAYTLQIGFYDEQFGDQFRQAAQEAAQVLRNDGHEAYFYHGPHRSMVTVGLFTENDFVQDGVQSVYGPRIRELQQKHPYNLGNGRTLIQKVAGENLGEQPSFIVRVRR